MPRGRPLGRGRGRRRGHSCDRGLGARRGAGSGAEEPKPPDDLKTPPLDAQFDTTPPSEAVPQRVSGQPLTVQFSSSAEEGSQNSTFLNTSLSAVVSYQLKADIGQFATGSEVAELRVSIDTKMLTENIRRSSIGGDPCPPTATLLSPETISETSAQYAHNVEPHSLRELESRSSRSDPDADVQSRMLHEHRAQGVGSHTWVMDPQILETTFVNKSKCASSHKQDKPFFSDHNANFLSFFASGSTVEACQSNDQNSVATGTPSNKEQCLHSTVPGTSFNDTTIDQNHASASVFCSKGTGCAENETLCGSCRINVPKSTLWEFSPPLQLPHMSQLPSERPTKQKGDFFTRIRPETLSLDYKCSKLYKKILNRQSESTLPSTNCSTSFNHWIISKWSFKPLPKRYLSKVRPVKLINVALKGIQNSERSGASIPLEEVFSVFCGRCRRPGHRHPRNQNKIIKKRCHRRYWSNLHVAKSHQSSNISNGNRETKCFSCQRTLWKCHRNRSMFDITDTTPNSHAALGSKSSLNQPEEIPGIFESETENSLLETTNEVQNDSSNYSDLHIPHTTAEDDSSNIVANFQCLNQDSGPTSKFKLQNVKLVVCLANEGDTESNGESQRVQVPCRTGQEFMEMSNMFNPYPCKISGIFGSENGISVCLEDQGDLSNEFDFDIRNSGELTLPSYEAQLIMSKDKAEACNFEESNLYLTVMCNSNSCAEATSHFEQNSEKAACNSETGPAVDMPQPLDDAGGQFNSAETTHLGTNDAPSADLSSSTNEIIEHIQIKESDALHGEAHQVVIPQSNGYALRQLTSIESMHSGSNRASSEEITTDINETVAHKKNYIQIAGMTAYNHETDGSSVITIQTIDNSEEQLNSTENTRSVRNEMLDKNERSAVSNENDSQSSTVKGNEDTQCFVCIKEETKISEIGKCYEKALEVVAANLLRKNDLCSNHSIFREKISACKNNNHNSITVKEETVKDEKVDFGPEGNCESVNCFMCIEEKKQMRQMPVVNNVGPVIVAKLSSNLVSKDKLIGQHCQSGVSHAGCSYDIHNGINNSSREAEALLVQSSESNANSTDMTTKYNEELRKGVDSTTSHGKTTKEVSKRSGDKSLSVTESRTSQQMAHPIMQLQDQVSSPDCIHSDNNNCIEEQEAEQINSLSSDSIEEFDCVADGHVADEVEDQLRNLFGENSDDSHLSKIQTNDTISSEMLMERDTEYRSCNIQDELSEQNVPDGSEKQSGIPHEDEFQQNCDISSTNESQLCSFFKDEEHNLTTENTESEINDEMFLVMAHEQNTEYRLYNDQEQLTSNKSPLIEHEQQNYDISSTNESHNNLIKYESSSDQEHENCFSYSQTDSDSDSSVQIIAEIRHSEDTLNNQPNERPLYTVPLGSSGSEGTSEVVGSKCSSMTPITEIMHSESLLTNQSDDKQVPKSPLRTFSTKETIKSVVPGCPSTLDKTTLRHSEGISNDQHLSSYVFKYPQNRLISEEAVGPLGSKCTATLARTLASSVDCDSSCTAEAIHDLKRHPGGTSSDQPIKSQVSKYPQNNSNIDETCESSGSRHTSTLAKTLDSSVDCDTTSSAETINAIKTTQNFPEREQTGVPVIRVSIPLSSITDTGLLEKLMAEKKKRNTEGRTGPPSTQTHKRRPSENSSDVQYSPCSKSKRKATDNYGIKRMNGRGKRTFEKVSQAKEVGDESSVPDLPLHRVSEKKSESDYARAGDVRELSSSGTNKYRDMLDNNENQNAKELFKEKNAHQSAVLPPHENVSDEEGELQICEEPLEGDEEEEAQDDNSEENTGGPHNMFSHEGVFEDKDLNAERIFESDKPIKTQDVEGNNLIAHQKDDDIESPHYSCGNQEAPPECQAVSVPDENKARCKRKLLTDAGDELLMVVSSNATQNESLSPPQKCPEIELPCSPLQTSERHIQSNNMLSKTAIPIISSDSNVFDVKARGDVKLKYCDSLDVPDSLQSEKSFLVLDKGSNNLTSKGRISAEEKVSPFRKISRRTINETDIHGKSREEQEIGNDNSSACVNEVLVHNSSKSSTRRISSKPQITYTDLDSLPPSYQTLRRDLNEVLEREKLYQATYAQPTKVRKKLPVQKGGGHRRPRECQSTQIINDGEESISKRIRREQPDGAKTELSVEDQGNSSFKKETETTDRNPNTRNLCQQYTDMTAVENADVHHHHQHHKKKKPAIVQPEEMEQCHDKPTLPEKESTVSPVCQLNMLSNKRKKCTVRLKRCDRFSWIQCENESTVAESADVSTEETSTSANESTAVESPDMSTEKIPTSDECGRTECLPEKNATSEHISSKESDDCSDKSSVLPRLTKMEMENSTSVTKEHIHSHSKQLLNKNTSQKVHEDDEESHVFTGRKDYAHRFSVEEKEDESPSPKPVELTDEAVCFHEHKGAMEVSQSHHKKILFLAENKNINDSNIPAVGEQSKQHLSQIPDEITTPEKTVNDPNQATHHRLTRQNGVDKNMDNKQQDFSVNCGVDKEGNGNNQSTYKVAASHSEGHIPHNFVESRSHSPHFENSGSQSRETYVELVETISRIVKDQKHPIYAIVGRLGEEIKVPHQLLQDIIQIEKHEPDSEASGDFSTEQLVPEQVSQEPNIEFQQDRQSPLEQPVSAPEETNEQYITKNQLKKSATDTYDSVETLPKSHHCEADSQDVTLHQREPAAHEVKGSHTENDSLPSTQHTKCDSQTHDLRPQPHTSQSHRTVTSNQFLIKESLSCSENVKQYSKPTSTDQEEETRHQKADQHHVIQPSLNERQASQEKEAESHNAQAPSLTQQQVQDEHRAMLNTIKQQKQQCSSKQEIAQQKYHKEYQQSSHQQSVTQSHPVVPQWHHIQHVPQHHQARFMDINKVVPQQQNVCSGAPKAEKEASIVQNTMGHHQALLQQQQQLQHLASLEQQPSRQLAAMRNPMEQPQQTMQQQIEWQQQRAAYHASKQHPTVEHQTQHQQQPHPYQHQMYFPQIQQHHQYPHSTEVQTRPNYPHQYHPRFNTPPTWNSNLHLLRQVPHGPLDGQQLQPQQQQYTHFHNQQNLERWHFSRRPGTDVAATVPTVLATPSMSGGTVVESEHDRRRVLSREAINSFDTGHRIGAVPSSSCPMTPANTENIHTAQAHPTEAYMRAGPHLHPNNTTATMQPPLSTAPIHQRHMGVVPSSTVDQDQRPAAHGGRLKIPTPPVVSAFVERVMKHYQPDMLNTEMT